MGPFFYLLNFLSKIQFLRGSFESFVCFSKDSKFILSSFCFTHFSGYILVVVL